MFLQALALWVENLTLWGKSIDSNNFNGDTLPAAIKAPWLDYKDKKGSKSELDKPKYFSHEKWTQWLNSVYNYLSSRKDSLGVILS